MDCTQNCQHGKPHKHEWSKNSTDRCRSKLLEKKEQAYNDQDNNNNCIRRHVLTKNRKFTESFNCRSDGNWRSDNTICEQSRTAEHGRYDKPLSSASYEGIQRKCSTFPPVIRSQDENDIFDRCL